VTPGDEFTLVTTKTTKGLLERPIIVSVGPHAHDLIHTSLHCPAEQHRMPDRRQDCLPHQSPRASQRIRPKSDLADKPAATAMAPSQAHTRQGDRAHPRHLDRSRHRRRTPPSGRCGALAEPRRGKKAAKCSRNHLRLDPDRPTYTFGKIGRDQTLRMAQGRLTRHFPEMTGGQSPRLRSCDRPAAATETDRSMIKVV